MNADLLTAAALAKAWPDPTKRIEYIDGEAEWFRRALSDICDTAMPRSRPQYRQSVYWWTSEIETARNSCIKAQSQFQRSRRMRNRDIINEELLYRRYREAVSNLQQLIKDAKTRAWDELTETLNHDLWGRPYRIVLGKLLTKTPPVTEALNPDVLERALDVLFPACEDEPSPARPVRNDLPVPAVTEELDRAISRMVRKNTAPRPHGIPGRALALALRQSKEGCAQRQSKEGV
ncbi:uncharacterized protein LOC122535519 [Frieseomelitta varia]|uniref:uncharacterized protein LOC122535519 n=1 Tax=Frieseomelitta varia TaxID=561572 RepID=UPI001CB684CE|nr:uncharacterized protein LOC122535519 [Frieseomelitta varia]